MSTASNIRHSRLSTDSSTIWSKLKTMRRYPPNVGKDKDKNAVDSWYLYHPLLNPGHLATDGDAKAKRLFTSSLHFAIEAAHHFEYAWPIQSKVTDFSVIVKARNDDGLGQTDVGGLYAHVMLQEPRLSRHRGRAVQTILRPFHHNDGAQQCDIDPLASGRRRCSPVMEDRRSLASTSFAFLPGRKWAAHL